MMEEGVRWLDGWLYEARDFEYIEVGERPWLYQGYGQGPLIPIVPCPRCGWRFVEDPNHVGVPEGTPHSGR